jgi:hypothetical protein
MPAALPESCSSDAKTPLMVTPFGTTVGSAKSTMQPYLFGDTLVIRGEEAYSALIGNQALLPLEPLAFTAFNQKFAAEVGLAFSQPA